MRCGNEQTKDATRRERVCTLHLRRPGRRLLFSSRRSLSRSMDGRRHRGTKFRGERSRVHQPTSSYLVGKRYRFLAETPKPKQAPPRKPKYWPNRNFGRNTFFGRNRQFRPKRILFGQKCLFRPKYCIFLAYFWATFWPKHGLSAEIDCFGRKKCFGRISEKGDSQNTETVTYFGRNFRPKPNRNCFGLPTILLSRAHTGCSTRATSSRV